jgi:hypothetical protein
MGARPSRISINEKPEPDAAKFRLRPIGALAQKSGQIFELLADPHGNDQHSTGDRLLQRGQIPLNPLEIRLSRPNSPDERRQVVPRFDGGQEMPEPVRQRLTLPLERALPPRSLVERGVEGRCDKLGDVGDRLGLEQRVL